MWQVLVRYHGEPAWTALYASTGASAEMECRRRFDEIRALFTGEWDDAPNLHAGEWQAACLVRDGMIVEGCERDEHVTAWSDAENGNR